MKFKIKKFWKWYWGIGLVYMVIMIFLLFCFPNIFWPSEEEQEREIVEYYLFQEFDGVVEKVFVDEDNHQYKTVLIREKTETKKMLLDFDASPLFSILKRGDSLQKNLNQLDVKIKRKGKDTIINFEFVFNPNKYIKESSLKH